MCWYNEKITLWLQSVTVELNGKMDKNEKKIFSRKNEKSKKIYELVFISFFIEIREEFFSS